MKLVRAQAYDDWRSPAAYGKVHAAWDDGEGSLYTVCSARFEDGTLFDHTVSPITCGNCRRLKLSRFRRVMHWAQEMMGW